MVFLDFSVTLVLELENISAEKDFLIIFSVLLYEQPSKGMQYLESSMLIGTLIALSIFNKQGNLVFLRSAGFSPIKIVLNYRFELSETRECIEIDRMFEFH